MPHPARHRPRYTRLTPLAAAIALSLGSAGHAATIVVTHAGDAHVPGGCSLREAVQSASNNAAPAGTSCAVGTAIDVVEIPFPQISLVNGTLNVSGPNNTLRGTLGQRTVITRASGASAFRIITHQGGDLLLDNLAITGGSAATGCGGGIFSQADAGNRLFVSASLVADNTAAQGGGGVCAQGSTHLLLERSTVSGNIAAHGGGGLASKYQTSIIDSTIAGNTSGAGGGGLQHGTGTAVNQPLLMENSTIADNVAEEGGGGILVSRSAVTIRNSTITRNTALGSSSGAGIHIGNTNGATMILSSSLLAGNTTQKYFRDLDAQTSFTVAGSHNLVRSHGSNITLPLDTKTCAPLIRSLGSYGGSTPTVAISSNDTCVVNTGQANGMAFDQRGPGFPRVVGPAADIGAFEYRDLIFANGFQ